ncbi:DinB family protein [Neolewinella persica]|uniref:DinB family protein n=1 Tax=Neolewinella persica TaxID=70998 RepID=UPI0003719DBC|nr:DinB family protein [Neolewinella persica]
MRITELKSNEYHKYYANYIGYVDDLSLRSALDESEAQLLEYLTHVSEEHTNYAYAPGKWTIAQSLQHIIDTERIFSYRALRIGRGDVTPLPGFEQNDYAAVANVSDRRFRDMIDEFRTVRAATKALFNSFTEEDLIRLGTMSGGPASVRALGFIISGHVYHHAKLYREKYGKAE